MRRLTEIWLQLGFRNAFGCVAVRVAHCIAELHIKISSSLLVVSVVLQVLVDTLLLEGHGTVVHVLTHSKLARLLL